MRHLACALALLAPACAARRPPAPLVVPDIPAPTRAHATALPILAGDGSGPIGWTDLVTRAARADAVLIGETHAQELGLAMAAELLRQAIEASRATLPESSPALALEFFERDQQVAIDDYLGAVFDEAGFLNASGRTVGNYPPGHRAMVEAARARAAPVYAANAPRRYVRLARTDGLTRLDRLTPAQRDLVTQPGDLTTGRYRDDFFELMSSADSHGDGAGPTPKEIEGFFRSQNVWDATMADTVSRALSSGHAPVFLVVGRFHTDFDGGLTQRLRASHSDATILTISVLDVAATELRAEDRGRADAVVYARSQ